jgi:hypothetical protein
MNFIDKEYGALHNSTASTRSGLSPSVSCRNDASHIGHTARYSGKVFKMRLRLAGAQTRQSGFAGAGGAKENARRRTIGFDGSPQWCFGRDEVSLPHELVKVTWSQAGRQWQSHVNVVWIGAVITRKRRVRCGIQSGVEFMFGE